MDGVKFSSAGFPPSFADVLGSLYGGVMATPTQAAEPMGNSIRKLLNSTRGGAAGWQPLDMAELPEPVAAEPEPEPAVPPRERPTAQQLGWYAMSPNHRNLLSRMPPKERRKYGYD